MDGFQSLGTSRKVKREVTEVRSHIPKHGSLFDKPIQDLVKMLVERNVSDRNIDEREGRVVLEVENRCSNSINLEWESSQTWQAIAELPEQPARAFELEPAVPKDVKADEQICDHQFCLIKALCSNG